MAGGGFFFTCSRLHCEGHWHRPPAPMEEWTLEMWGACCLCCGGLGAEFESGLTDATVDALQPSAGSLPEQHSLPVTLLAMQGLLSALSHRK